VDRTTATARRAGVRIEQAGRTAGYAYISAEGHVGPLAIAPDTDAKAVATTALRCALESRPQRSFRDGRMSSCERYWRSGSASKSPMS